MVITNYIAPNGHKTKIIAKTTKEIIQNIESLEKAHNKEKSKESDEIELLPQKS